VTSESPQSPDLPIDAPRRSPSVAIARYGAARLGLVAALSALLVLVGVPLLVAIMVALVVALPLSLVLFPRLRRDLDAALAEAGARRKEQKARLRAQLSGERAGWDRSEPAQDGQSEADGGAEGPDQHDHGGVAQNGNQVASPNSAEHPPNR
jgi:uncharacterized protein DUF4229